jgi:hypothetical protein
MSTLAELISEFVIENGPAYRNFPDGGYGAIPDWNVSEPPYVFANAGPQAFQAIWTGPGLQRGVFNAALWLQMHGTTPVSGAPAVRDIIVAAVKAYISSNPANVPTGAASDPVAPPALGTPIGPPYLLPATNHYLPAPLTTDTPEQYFVRVAKIAGGDPSAQGAFFMGGGIGAIANELGLDPAQPTNWPMIIDCFFNWAAYNQSAMAAGAAQDARIAAEDAGVGDVAPSTISEQDLYYLQATLGPMNVVPFLRNYTSGTAVELKNFSMSLDINAANSSLFAQNGIQSYSNPKLEAAASAFKAQQLAAEEKKKAAK